MGRRYGIRGSVGPAPGFSWEEVRDGWGRLPTSDWQLRRIVYQARYLNQLRKETAEYFRVPKSQVTIYVTSWYRSWGYNAHIGGASRSQHPQCRATDILVVVKKRDGKIVRLSPRFVGLLARRVGAFSNGGIGTYDRRHGNFTHVDHRRGTARWGSPPGYAVPA